jgi:small-conductance mechanosensitive channel
VAGGIFAIVIGFAAQSIVGNLISGIFLIFERPVKIGDVVNIDSTIGQVEDIRIISTTIRTFDGHFVRIPNMTVFNAKIINYFVNKARRFEYTVGIRYMDDADNALKIIRETIEEHPFALKYPEPVLFVDTLGDSSVNVNVKIWAPFTEWYDVRKDLLWKIKTRLEKNGIMVPFPQREVWFRNELKMDDRN